MSSLIDLRKADAAAKEAKISVLLEEARRKEEITRIEAQFWDETTRVESELARRTIELEQVQVKKHGEIASARL